MVVRIPNVQEVVYTPGLAYVLKFAWIQYFCAFIFWWVLLYKGFLNYTVICRVFECTEVMDLNTDNIKKL